MLTPEQAAASKTDITQKIGDKAITVGTMSISEDGTVALEFNDSLDTSQPFDGTFQFSATTSYEGNDDTITIKIPGASDSTDTEITVAKPTDLGIKKTSKVDDTKADALYIDYTVTVSSEKGWKDPIHIGDELQDKTQGGTFVRDSFVLRKSSEPTARIETPTFNDEYTTFEYENLPALGAGESYTLTYKVKLPKGLNPNWDIDYNNVARTDNNQSTWNSTKLYSRIRKQGSYDSTTDKIKWVITVNNPYGGSLKGYTVTDTPQDGTTITGNVELKCTSNANGNWDGWTMTFDPQKYPNKAAQNGFAFTFSNSMTGEGGKTNDATGKTYTFTYYTDAPRDTDGKMQPIKNDSELDAPNNGPKYPASDTVTPADRSFGVEKKSRQNNELQLVEGKENLYTAGWTVSAVLPNAGGTYEIVDAIRKPDPAQGDHYGTVDELDKALKNGLELTLTNGTVLHYADFEKNKLKLTIEYYTGYEDANGTRTPMGAPLSADSTEKVRCFKVTLDTTDYTGTAKTQKLTLLYNTFVDTTDMEAGQNYWIQNFANNKDDHYDYKPTNNTVTFDKYVSTDERGAFTKDGIKLPGSLSQDSKDFNNDPGTYQSNDLDTIYLNDFKNTLTANYADSQYLYYQLRLDFTAASIIPQDSYTFTDTLPKGLEFDTDYTPQAIFCLNGWWSKYAKFSTSSDKWNDMPFLNDPAHFSCSGIENTLDGGQKRTFTLNGLQSINTDQQVQLRYIVIIYRVKLADNAFWKLPTSTERHYTNTAACQGFPDSSADVDITRNTKRLDKQATFVKDDVKKELRIKYRVEINQGAEDLLAGHPTADGMVTLTDTIQTSTNIHLDAASVHLYDYPYIEGLSTPLDPLQYEMHYSKPAEGSTAPYTHIITLKVPNKHGYVLMYDYLVDDVVNINTTITNNAQLTGADPTRTDTAVTGFTSSATANQAGITLYKVDSLNDLTRLPGAKFTLSKFDNGSGKFVDVNNPLETDVDGKITIFRDNFSGGLTNDVLYRLEETQAPDGYAMPTDGSQYLYFVWANQNQTPDAAWKSAISSSTSSELPAKEKVQLLSFNGNITVNMANTRTYLTLKKFWQDEYGQDMDGSVVAMDQIEVNLYHYKAGNGNTPDPDKDEHTTITLKKNPTLDVDGTTTPWTYVVKNVDSNCHYYIREANPDSLHDVTYSANNTVGVTGGGLLTLTNRLHKEYGKLGRLTLNKKWVDSNGNLLADTNGLSATFTLTKNTAHTNGYTVKIVPAEGYTGAYHGPVIFAKNVPQGACLYFISSNTTSWDTVATTYGLTLGHNAAVDGAYKGQNVHTIGPINSDLTIVDNALYMADNECLWTDRTDTGSLEAGTTSTEIGAVTLNTDNKFTHTWENLDLGDGITYTLTEKRVDGYTASYTFNSEPLRDSFSLTGGDDTVTVTNTAGDSGYELPSTGGAGTKLYTAGGAALMLAALVCGFCTKRRRERRAHR